MICLGKKEIVDILLQAHADVEATEEDKWTPLFLAVQQRKLYTLKINKLKTEKVLHILNRSKRDH